MITTKQFYDLHNKEVSRKELQTILAGAHKEQNAEVVFRLAKILRAHPNTEAFTISIKKNKIGLAAPQSKNIYQEALSPCGVLKKGWSYKNGTFVAPVPKKKVEPVTSKVEPSFLAGLEYIEADDAELKEGLGKGVSPADIYKMITEKVIKSMESVKGNSTMPWDDKHIANGGYMIPHNFASKKSYRGINILLLKDGNPYHILENPYFLTFKQVKELKGKVKKGVKGFEVVYFTRLFKFENKDKKESFGTYSKEKMNKFLASKGYNTKQFDLLVTTLPILKYYHVYNAVDIEGIDFGLTKLSELEKARLGFMQADDPKHKDAKNAIAELIIKNRPNPKVKIEHKENRAYYIEDYDKVNMPSFTSFTSASDYYRVLFHELIHATGHKKRLARDLKNKFGSVAYAKEELIAEFGAVFLSAQAGILWHTNDNHQKYIKSWLSALAFMKKDHTLLMRAATAAQKASDFMLQLDEKGDPKFYQELKQVTKPKAKKQESKQLVLALNGVSKDPDTITYNKQIKKAAKKGFSNDDFFILGRPKGVLSEYVDNYNIQHRGALLQKSILDKHQLNWGHFMDLPDKLNNPLFIFESTSRNKNELVIVVALKDVEGNRVVVPIRLDKKFRVINITSVYGKENPKFIENWKAKDLLIYEKSALNGRPTAPIAAAPNKAQDKDKKTALNNPIPIIETSENEEVIIVPAPAPAPKEVAQEPKPIIAPGPTENIVKPEPIKKEVTVNDNSLAAQKRRRQNKTYEYYTIVDNDLATFLGKVEKKTEESVVITVTGGQGSMKTRFAFRCMNIFAQNNKVGHASIEEGVDNAVYWKKADEYFNETALNNIDAPKIESVQDLHKLIMENDVIVIDSFAKMQEIQKGFEVDKDLRKKYNGKLFIVIFQQTADGKMRGGTKSQFDADIVLFTEKCDDYRHNYIYTDKNRYQDKPLNELQYNIFHGRLNDLSETVESTPVENEEEECIEF